MAAAQSTGDAAEHGADGHAHARGVALPEHVAGHHLARGEQVGARLPAEVHRAAAASTLRPRYVNVTPGLSV
jgi:hypothetical protein